MSFKNAFSISIALVLSFFLLLFTPDINAKEPKSVYRVYLAGQEIGLIENAEALEQYINNEQEMLREKYKVL